MPAEESKDKYTLAALIMLLAIDAIPCESSWAILLPNFKKALTKKAIRGLGMCAFAGLSGAIAAMPQVDSEDAARAEYLAQLAVVWVRRAQDYLNNSDTFHELAVLTWVLRVAGQFLGALLCGVGRKDP